VVSFAPRLSTLGETAPISIGIRTEKNRTGVKIVLPLLAVELSFLSSVARSLARTILSPLDLQCVVRNNVAIDRTVLPLRIDELPGSKHGSENG